ncbi:hypothetical protein PFMALIP_05371, partial [Plasmodium falciparum MaliPS096_E11]
MNYKVINKYRCYNYYKFFFIKNNDVIKYTLYIIIFILILRI